MLKAINFYLSFSTFTWYADVATPQTKSLGKVSYKRGSSYSNCPIAEDKRDSKMDPRNSILSSS